MPPKDAVNENHASQPRDTGGGLRDAIDSMREAFARFGADDRLVFCNEAYTRLHPLGKEFIRPGVLFEDIIRTNVEKGNVADAIGREEEYIRERMDLHRNPKGPIYRRLANGSTFIINECRTPDGGVLITSTEVTELKRAEEALRSSDNRLRGAIDSIQEAFAFYDADDRLVLFNEEFRRLHPNLDDVLKPGMYFEDLIRAHTERGMNADAIGREEEHIRKRMEQHRNPKGTITRTLIDGTSYIIKENRTPDGGTAVTETDITERLKLESQARAEHGLMLDAIESIDGGVALFDADDVLVLCNSTYREKLREIEHVLAPGFTYEEILRAYAEKGINTEAKADPEKYVRERLARHRNLEPSTIQMTKTGDWIMLREYRTSEGGTLIIRTDVTERKKA